LFILIRKQVISDQTYIKTNFHAMPKESKALRNRKLQGWTGSLRKFVNQKDPNLFYAGLHHQMGCYNLHKGRVDEQL